MDNILYRDKLVHVAYTHLKLSSTAVFVNVVVLLFMLYGEIENRYLFSWAGAMLFITTLRLASSFLYDRNKRRFSILEWEKIFLVGVSISGVLWAMASWLLFTPESLPHQMMLLIVLAGISSGAISTLSSFLKTIQLFLILLIVPIFIQFLLQGNSIHTTMALLIFLYLVMSLIVAKRFHKSYLDVIESRQLFKEEKEKLSFSEDRFKTIFNNAPIGIFFYDTELKVLEFNQEFCNVLEAPSKFLVGLDLSAIKDTRILPSIRASLDNMEGFYEGEYVTAFKKKAIWVTLRTSPLLNAKKELIGGIGIFTDISERIEIQKQIEHQAHHDALTNIPNRITFMKDMHQEIIRYQRHEIIFAILFLDLDHFKNVNDSLGHKAGDTLLIEITKRLQDTLRDEDIVARIGGDEFVVILPDLAYEQKEAANKAKHIAQKIHEALEIAMDIEGHRLLVTASIGIVLINDSDMDADDLLKHADIAMYQAKKDGRGVSRFYQDEMDRWAKRQLKIENRLKDAIKHHELELYYQPIVEFSTQKLVGAEALIRWHCDEIGLIDPDEFIPIAEESGSIMDIGEWVLDQAIKQFKLWKKEFPHIESLQKIALNVSTKQFNHPDFLTQIHQVLERNSFDPKYLELELTESIIITNVEDISKKMHSLRDLGISISIDDFGTGYSSLSYLKKLPFSTLKIDKSFIQDIQDNVDDKELISTIITIANNFNLYVITEGVELQEQYIFLRDKGCQYLQGFYCSKPMNGEDFMAMLKKDGGVFSKLA